MRHICYSSCMKWEVEIKHAHIRSIPEFGKLLRHDHRLRGQRGSEDELRSILGNRLRGLVERSYTLAGFDTGSVDNSIFAAKDVYL
jgi:hypothetical protein